ncbi:MAG: hypothetical protein Q9160_008977 [Pyrenula sp. 1 TL-2023]
MDTQPMCKTFHPSSAAGKNGAKIVPFGGYSMPLHYTDLNHVESHHWTRSKASLFDVSHMVQHEISGPSAEAFLMKITPSSLPTLPELQSTLSCFLKEPTGGIVDDTVILRLGPQKFHIVTNAGCREGDLKFLQDEMNAFSGPKPDWQILEKHSLFAFQGPETSKIIQPLIAESKDSDTDLSTLFFSQSRCLSLKLPDGSVTPPLLFSRTGYTGEDGFEISIPFVESDRQLPIKIAKGLLADPSTSRLAGLAARDSLRLEAGMCLYGHDLNIDTTPPVGALGWVVGKDRRDPEKADFNGAKTILEQLASPKTMEQRRIGLIVEKGAPAREGAEIVNELSGEVIGRVTSGLPSPSLDGTNIAIGYVKNGYHKRGTKVAVKVRKNVRKAEIAKMPFVESKFYRP